MILYVLVPEGFNMLGPDVQVVTGLRFLPKSGKVGVSEKGKCWPGGGGKARAAFIFSSKSFEFQDLTRTRLD